MAEELPQLSLPPLPEGTSDASAVLRHDTRARFILALIVVAQFVLLIGWIIYTGKQLPDSQLVVGAEISFMSVVLTYFFGSSAGSVTKSAKSEPKTTETTSTTSSP
jgi:hypothetical protein